MTIVSLVIGQFSEEPRSRLEPLSLDGDWRQFQHQSGLLYTHSTEVPHLHYSTLPLVDRREAFECLIESKEIFVFQWRGGQCLVEFDLMGATAPLLGQPGAGAVDKEASHDFSTHGKEMGPVLPGYFVATYQPQVRLMHQRGCL